MPRNNHTLIAIVLSVLFIHGLFLGFGMYWNSSEPPTTARNKIIAQTIELPREFPPSKQISNPAKVVSQQPKSVKPKPVPSKPKKEIAVPPKPRKVTVPTKNQKEPLAPAPQKKEPNEKQKALLSKAKENLSKVGQAQSFSNESLAAIDKPLPKQLDQLKSESILQSQVSSQDQESTYIDEISSFIKNMLKLPEYGAVKIKLTLNKEGRVLKVETLQTESAINKAYIEKKIPTLLFPSFSKKFQIEQKTFIITLKND